MAKKIKSFRDVWTFPLTNDDSGCVWDSEDLRVFDFNEETVSKANQRKIKSCLNDEFEPAVFKPGTLEYREEGEIYHTEKQERYIDIRGWGHLTGTLQLSAKEAAKLQDELGTFIINRLTNDPE
jgi:hypothetical protein